MKRFHNLLVLALLTGLGIASVPKPARIVTGRVTDETGQSQYLKAVDPLKYQRTQPVTSTSDEWLTLKIRYKRPDSEQSQLLTQGVSLTPKSFDSASENFRFASAVAEFGLLLRDSEYLGEARFNHVVNTAKAALGRDEEGQRGAFVRLVKTATARAEE